MLWVTIRMVTFSLSSVTSSSMLAVAIGSSAEVGSSNRMISGIGCQGARDAQALLLAAGKVGAQLAEPVADLVPQRGALERGFDAVVEFVLVAHAAHAQAVGDVLVDRLGEGVRLLEHHADAHAHFDRIDVGRQQIGVVRVKHDAAAGVAVARIQVVHAIEAAQQRRLAATRGADQRRHLRS
jgi:hypothetical protein